MSLLLFLIGLFIIFCIGRYNESNKLFWILLISFISSFAITSVAIKAALGKGKKVEKVSCVSLTQAPASKSGIFLLADYALAGTQVLYNTKPVGKGTLCSLCNFTEDSSCSGLNNIYMKMLKPPQNTSYFDDS
jgi:hypothetical protein|nr:MAG TPA: hypothetical protein [Caudoviricetes sp.]